MRRIGAAVLAALLLTVLAGCGGDKTVGITEGRFIAQVNDVKQNPQAYTGKQIKLEGLYKHTVVNGTFYGFVYRLGPGCCGNDGDVGFYFTKDDLTDFQDNDWVEVVGKAQELEGDVVLRATSVRKLDTRGAETVGQ